MSLLRRAVLFASLIVPAVPATLVSADAQACSFETGLVQVTPSSGQTLAENDNIVLVMQWGELSEYAFEVLVDGVSVPFDTPPLFSESLIFLSRDYYAIRLGDGAAPEGSTITVRKDQPDISGDEEEWTFVVGPADDSALVSGDPTVTLDLWDVGAESSCGIPEHHLSEAELVGTLNEDGKRKRYLELVYYPQGANPIQDVARGVVGAPGFLGEGSVFASMPKDEDLSTLCAQVAVRDAQGQREVLMEDCDLCGTYPEACSESGCAVGPRGSAPGSLLMLLPFGVFAARRRNLRRLARTA